MLIITSCGSNKNNQEIVEAVSYKPIAANYTSSAIRAAAETGMTTFIGDDWANWGFVSANEFASAQLGAPLPYLTLSNAGKSNQMLIVGNIWSFPVMVNNDYRCMLRVAKIHDQWQTVTLIGGPYITSIQTAENYYPILNIKTRGIVSTTAGEILVLNPTENQPSFIFLRPFFYPELINKITKYSGWVSTDPIPTLSFEELFILFS